MLSTNTKKGLTFCLFILITSFVSAQKDTLILTNNDVIIGEVKDMDRGVVTVSTDYSKDDFRVKWGGIKKISTNSSYIITLKNGDRLHGNIKTADSAAVNIHTIAGINKLVKYQELVFLKPIKTSFKDRLNAAVDFGFSLTKAQNLKQITLRSTVGYLAENWSLNATYNTLFSNQDHTDQIRRTDGGLSYKYLLPKDWYLPASVTFLSNSEQQLDLRLLESVGVGKYLLHSNQSYWGVASGITHNDEKYFNIDARKSWEAYLGTELNLYDIGKLNLLTKMAAYPSLTQSGRWRYDFNFDAKYDLPLNLYIKFGITYNYDNQPVAGASNTDYVMQTGIGWKL